MNKIFFSWQSDIPEHKSVLVKAIEQAIIDLDDWELEMAERNPEGADDIAVVILDKINKSALFIGDVSIVGEYEIATSDEQALDKHQPRRKTINPNVAYEVGYAMKALTPQRVILLAARSTTPDTTSLPFDVRNRRTMIRDFSEARIKSLAKELKEIIVQPRVPLATETPYIFIRHIGGWSQTDKQMAFEIYNEEPNSYMLESIELGGSTISANRALDKDGATTKVVLIGLPIPPFEERIETISLIVSRHKKRFRITQQLQLGDMAIEKFNLIGVIPTPTSIEPITD